MTEAYIFRVICCFELLVIVICIIAYTDAKAKMRWYKKHYFKHPRVIK